MAPGVCEAAGVSKPIGLVAGDRLEVRIEKWPGGELEVHVRNPATNRIILDRAWVDRRVGSASELLIRVTADGVRIELGDE